MVAASPGKVDGEAAEEVEEGPGQDNDVVGIEEHEDHLGGVADACRGNGQIELGTIDRFLTHYPPLLRGRFVLHSGCPGCLLCPLSPQQVVLLRAPTALPRLGGDLYPCLLQP